MDIHGKHVERTAHAVSAPKREECACKRLAWGGCSAPRRHFGYSMNAINTREYDACTFVTAEGLQCLHPPDDCDLARRPAAGVAISHQSEGMML